MLTKSLWIDHLNDVFNGFYLISSLDGFDQCQDEGDLDHGAPVVRVTRATPVLPPGVTDDTPDFNRDQVMLDIPDELFGSSFTMVTNISKIFGNLMLVSIYIWT